MPDDMQSAEKLAVATIFGTGSRFQFAAPKCRLSRDADPDIGDVSFPADCMRFGQTTIAQWINKILALGAKIVFSIDGTSTRCSISRLLKGTDVGNMAVAHVDDSLCSRMVDDPQNVPHTGDHVMLPRFVVYNSVDTGYNQLAILGGPKSSGLWFAMPDNLYNCEDGELKSICGHYREWGLTPNDPDIKLGAAISIDVAAHRQVYAVNLVMLADRELSQVSLSVAEQTSPKKTAPKKPR
jgi:hypothetical protein